MILFERSAYTLACMHGNLACKRANVNHTVIIMNKFLSNLFLFTLFIFSCQSSWAQATWSPVATFSVGEAWAKAGETQRFYLQPDVEKNYAANKQTNRLAGIELFWGVQRELNSSLLGQVGLVVAKSGHANLQGDVWEDADPDFNNYSYRYRVRHSHVGVKGLLLIPAQYGLLPYISASLGIGTNDAYDFTSTPKIEEETPVPRFTNHSTTSFTYTIGLGLRKAINKNWQMGVSYEFSDWGKSQLGAAPGQTTNAGLKMDHLYTQGVYLNLSYIFNEK